MIKIVPMSDGAYMENLELIKYNICIIDLTIFDCVLVGPMPLKRPMNQTPGDI